MSFLGKIFDVITAPVKWVGKAFQWVGKKVGGDVGKFFYQAGNLVVNTAKYIEGSVSNIFDDLFSFKIGKLFEDVLDFGSTILLVGGSFLSSNPYAIAGAIAYLDAKVNSGGFLIRPLVNIATGIADDVFGINNARKYRDEVAAVFSIGAGILAGFGASAFLGSLGLSNQITNIYNTINAIGNIYGGYSSYKAYQDLKDELERKLNELSRYYANLEQEKQKVNDLFLNQALEFNLYDWFAGGKQYNAYSVGNSEYDYMNVKNPWHVALNESELKDKNYDELKDYLRFNSLNIYDDFFEKMLKIDDKFSIATLNNKKSIRRNQYLFEHLVSEYNQIINLYNNWVKLREYDSRREAEKHPELFWVMDAMHELRKKTNRMQIFHVREREKIIKYEYDTLMMEINKYGKLLQSF